MSARPTDWGRWRRLAASLQPRRSVDSSVLRHLGSHQHTACPCCCTRCWGWSDCCSTLAARRPGGRPATDWPLPARPPCRCLSSCSPAVAPISPAFRAVRLVSPLGLAPAGPALSHLCFTRLSVRDSACFSLCIPLASMHLCSACCAGQPNVDAQAGALVSAAHAIGQIHCPVGHGAPHLVAVPAASTISALSVAVGRAVAEIEAHTSAASPETLAAQQPFLQDMVRPATRHSFCHDD